MPSPAERDDEAAERHDRPGPAEDLKIIERVAIDEDEVRGTARLRRALGAEAGELPAPDRGRVQHLLPRHASLLEHGQLAVQPRPDRVEVCSVAIRTPAARQASSASACAGAEATARWCACGGQPVSTIIGSSWVTAMVGTSHVPAAASAAAAASSSA
jgi:hypothetical protein